MKSKKFNVEKYLTLLKRYSTLQNLPKINKKKFERCKFEIITKLVNELFNHKNSKESYINISSLIVVFLNALEERYAIDQYSEFNENENTNKENNFKSILKSAF